MLILWTHSGMLLKRRMGNGQWTMDIGQWAMRNGQWAMGNGQWAMRNGQWAMDNGNGRKKWSGFFWAPCNYDFFGDGRMWASVTIGQLNMEDKSILFVFSSVCSGQTRVRLVLR